MPKRTALQARAGLADLIAAQSDKGARWCLIPIEDATLLVDEPVSTPVPEPTKLFDCDVDLPDPVNGYDSWLDVQMRDPKFRAHFAVAMAEYRAENPEAPAEPGQWLIRNTSHNPDGMVNWWGPDRCGYTTTLAHAGRYSEEDAKHQARSRETDVAVPLERALALQVRGVPVHMGTSDDLERGR